MQSNILPLALVALVASGGKIPFLSSGPSMRQLGEGVQALGALGVAGGGIYALAQAPGPGTGAGGALTVPEQEQLRKAAKFAGIFSIAGGGVQAIGNFLSMLGR